VHREVQHVRDALHREFDNLVDMSDVQSGQQEQHFLSRALAALVVRRLAGADSATAADALIDGRGDTGVDAIVVSESGLHLWLIQSKWSDRGNAGFNVGAALKLVEGLKLIDSLQFDRFNTRFQRHAKRVETALRDPRTKITLVIALMGPGALHPDVERRLKDVENDFNTISPVLDHDVWGINRLWQSVRDDLAEPPISLEAKMDEWVHLAEPYEAYQGRISVAEVSEWYAVHGDRLFKKNIRQSLGLTEVNYELVKTLATNPGHFWYYNNGITLLCETAEGRPWRRGAPGGPIDLYLHGASVVNGAQTVAAIAEAMQKSPDAASHGYVTVKIITTSNCPNDFGINVTRTTNTQNRVERRDFVALDSVQEVIREDFALTLDKIYTFKRGELDPAPDAGCSIVEAAIAMACAYRNSELAARVKQNVDLLWESGSGGAYQLLFEKEPSACRIWRMVMTTRTVRETLHDIREEIESRAKVIADQGDFLIAHIVFQRLDLHGIDDLDMDWSPALEEAAILTTKTLPWLVYHLDMDFGSTSYIGSTFANIERCRLLSYKVCHSLDNDVAAPDLPPEYRPATPVPRVRRRPNAVPTLVNSGKIADGTLLIYAPLNKTESKALTPWIQEDPRRAEATWVNDRSKPLLWSYDGRRYSPSGLVGHMWELAEWEGRHKAVAGPSRWFVHGNGSLWDLAQGALVELNNSRST
jgi:hypothetical protein